MTKEPNCIEEGEMSATCTLCQTTEVVSTIPTNEVHSFSNKVLRAPTCADTGEGLNTCTRCNYSQSCTYSLLEHHYGEAMCKSPVSCTVCGHVNKDGIDHKYTLYCQDALTRYRPRVDYYKCEVCGEKKQEYYNANNERYDLDALEQMATDYAKSLGFNVIISDERIDYNEHKFSRDYHILETQGGPSRLMEAAKNRVDYVYEYYSEYGVENYTLWVTSWYYDGGRLLVGGFSIYIYVLHESSSDLEEMKASQ